jgi:predicted TIM-barrel fold metal-dependent hydrolase
MDMNRRGFLQRASLLAAAGGTAFSGQAEGGESRDDTSAPVPIRIIDTHQHLWDLSKFKLTWVRPPLDRSFTMKDYIEAGRGLSIVKAIYMEVAVPPGQRLEEAEYAIGLCQEPQSLTCAAVIAGQPGKDDFEPYIRRFKDSPYIKGVRGSFTSAEQMNDKKVIRNLRLLGDLGMRFDLNVPPAFLAAGARLVGRCPDTRFILDHCGNVDPVAFLPPGRTVPRSPQHAPEQWKADMDRLAARGNIICKISGLIDNVPGYPLTAADLAPAINYCLDTFGADRVVFASDWPVCLLGASLRNWVELLKEVVAGRAEKDRRKLFHDNAVRFYDLDSPEPRSRQAVDL